MFILSKKCFFKIWSKAILSFNLKKERTFLVFPISFLFSDTTTKINNLPKHVKIDIYNVTFLSDKIIIT